MSLRPDPHVGPTLHSRPLNPPAPLTELPLPPRIHRYANGEAIQGGRVPRRLTIFGECRPSRPGGEFPPTPPFQLSQPLQKSTVPEVNNPYVKMVRYMAKQPTPKNRAPDELISGAPSQCEVITLFRDRPALYIEIRNSHVSVGGAGKVSSCAFRAMCCSSTSIREVCTFAGATNPAARDGLP